MQTYDLDIVHSRESGNLDRLQQALDALDARYREHLPQILRPDTARMAGPGHHLLATDAGPIDVRGVIAGNRDYDALLPHSIELELDGSTVIRVLDLGTLIASKRDTGREKDKLVLPILERTLEEVLQGRSDEARLP